MKLNRSHWIAIGIFSGLSLWMLSGAFARNDKTQTAAAPQAVAAPKVRVADIAASELARAINVRGQTVPVRVVEIKAESAGRVIEVPAEKGALLSKGELIARLALDDRPARMAELKAIITQRERELNAAASLAQRGFGPDLRASEARAVLESAKAGLARLEVDIANTEIRAPIDGFLDERGIEVGAYLKVGDKLATMVDLKTILVVGSVSERDVSLLTLGGPGAAQLITGQKLEGRIRFISSLADSATRTFRVELEAANPEFAARAGVTAEMSLPLQAVRGHRVSPAILTLDDAGKIGVKTVDTENKVRFMPVSILSDSVESVLLGGLPDRVRVITVGQEYVVPGQTVEPVVQPRE